MFENLKDWAISSEASSNEVERSTTIESTSQDGSE